jgi:hypothetical protein
MVTVHFSFEVHCQRPPWAVLNLDQRYANSIYRIYVNHDLITERNWIWDNQTVLHENIWVFVEENSQHTLRLEPVIFNSRQAEFNIANVKTNVEDIEILDTSPVALTFEIHKYIKPGTVDYNETYRISQN